MIRSLIERLPSITITVHGKPYLTRYYLFFKDRSWGNVYIHHFHSSDQGDELHNHPWAWGLSLIIAGGYVEERASNPFTWEMKPVEGDGLIKAIGSFPFPAQIEKRDVGPFSLNFITTRDFHRVDLKDEKKGAWSIFIAGPRTKQWGFLDRNTSEYKDWRTNPEAIP